MEFDWLRLKSVAGTARVLHVHFGIRVVDVRVAVGVLAVNRFPKLASVCAVRSLSPPKIQKIIGT